MRLNAYFVVLDAFQANKLSACIRPRPPLVDSRDLDQAFYFTFLLSRFPEGYVRQGSLWRHGHSGRLLDRNFLG